HRRAVDPQQRAVGGENGAPPVLDPVLTAVCPDNSVRGDRISALVTGRMHLALKGVPVVWMNQLLEGRRVAFERSGRQPEERDCLGRPAVHVSDSVPLPGTHAGCLERQTIALFAGTQRR